MASAKDSISQDNRSLSEKETAEELTRAFQAFLMDPLQKVSLKIEGLMEELGNRDDRTNKLEERITSAERQIKAIPGSEQEGIKKFEKVQTELEDRVKELETKFDEILSYLKRMESHLSPVKAEREIVPKEAVIDIQGLIDQARAKEQENLKADKNSIELCLKNAGFWLERGERLKLMIKEAADSADEVIANSNTILEGLQEELNTALGSSQQGLNIIGRMLQGLVNQGDRLENLVEKIDLMDNLKELKEGSWRSKSIIIPGSTSMR